MWMSLVLLLIHKAYAIPITFIIFNTTDGIDYWTSLNNIHQEILSDPSCGTVALTIASCIGRSSCSPTTNPKDWPLPWTWLHTKISPIYERGIFICDGVSGQSGIVHYFPQYVPIFQIFPDSRPLPYDESYSGLTGTTPGDVAYPELTKVVVGTAVAQNAMEFISIPDYFCYGRYQEWYPQYGVDDPWIIKNNKCGNDMDRFLGYCGVP